MIEDIALRSLSAQPYTYYLVLSEVVMRQTLAIFNGITSRNMFGSDFRSLTVRVSIHDHSFAESRYPKWQKKIM